MCAARSKCTTPGSCLALLPQAKNSEMLVDCFYALEDFASLGKLMDALPAGNALLLSIGDKFQSVGLCNEGVAAFFKVRPAPAGSGSAPALGA